MSSFGSLNESLIPKPSNEKSVNITKEWLVTILKIKYKDPIYLLALFFGIALIFISLVDLFIDIDFTEPPSYKWENVEKNLSVLCRIRNMIIVYPDSDESRTFIKRTDCKNAQYFSKYSSFLSMTT